MSRGHLRSRSSGSWTIVIDVGRDLNGKRRQKSVTVRGTKKEANQRLTELLRQQDTGTYLDPKKMTVASYLNAWLRDYAEPSVSTKTYIRYESICVKHLAPALGRLQLQMLQPLHIQEYYNEALKFGRMDGKGGLSAQTVKHHHRVLAEAMKKAVNWQLINVNPCDAVDAPKPEKKEMRALDERESATLLDISKGTRLYIPIVIALTTGLRRGELIGLKWSDIDLPAKKLSINRTIEQTSKYGIVEKTPKTKKSRRSIALPNLAIRALKELRKEHSKQKLKLGPEFQDNGYLFINEDGTLWGPDAFTKAFRWFLDKTDIGYVRFHDLRHTHASQLLKQGINPKVVSERLGHSSIAITMDTYSHVLPGLQEEAASKINDALEDAISEIG